MTPVDDEAILRQEFVTFAGYLGAGGDLERGATQYVRAHASLPLDATPLDRTLVTIGRRHRFAAALADAYARLLRPYGLLRRKLVLTLAVLESSPATHAEFDTAAPSGAAVAWLSLAALGVRWALRTLAALLVLGPVHLVSALVARPRPRG
jgi:hypothetical protein